MLRLFSASLLIVLCPLLLVVPLFCTSCGTVCTSATEVTYWGQVVHLRSLICTSLVVFGGSATFPTLPPHFPENKWVIDGALAGPAENPLMWGKCHGCAPLCFPFPFQVLKVSFDRTLVVELTPETLFKTTASPLLSMSRRLCFSFGISRHDLGAEVSKTSSSWAMLSGLEGNIFKCF